jgi:hypothetical protein
MQDTEHHKLRQLHGCKEVAKRLPTAWCAAGATGWGAYGLCKAVLLVCSRATLMQGSRLLYRLPTQPQGMTKGAQHANGSAALRCTQCYCFRRCKCTTPRLAYPDAAAAAALVYMAVLQHPGCCGTFTGHCQHGLPYCARLVPASRCPTPGQSLCCSAAAGSQCCCCCPVLQLPRLRL